MKNIILPCLLAFHLMATAQYSTRTNFDFPTNLFQEHTTDLLIQNLPNAYAFEEEEIVLEFDVDHYLPVHFDEYAGLIVDESYLLIHEEIPFDFDIEAYLPLDFDPYQGLILENTLPEEIDKSFNFNLCDYLPKGFNPIK
ncbi:hypothetical protein MWU59_11955 [Flavobacteriaceae bacterium F08102]|nr:hypothetical protein [Flavobacteriaceae bacterium F08102]